MRLFCLKVKKVIFHLSPSLREKLFLGMKQLLGAFLDPQPGQCHFPANVCCVNTPQRMGLCSQTEQGQLPPHPMAAWRHQLHLAPASLYNIPGELSAGSTHWVLWSRSQIPPSHAHSLLQIRFSSLIVQRFKSTLTPKYMHSHTEVKHQVRHIHEAFEKPVKSTWFANTRHY